MYTALAAPYSSCMNDAKNNLRLEARRHRVRMDIRAEDPETAASLFFKSIKPTPDQIVAAYWPMGKEFDTSPILEQLSKSRNICGLPVVDKYSLVLKFARWQGGDEELHKTDLGVFEPAITEKTEWLEPDIVIVPLLAFDRRGYRLGHGGGYYDATLKALRAKKSIVAVGLAYSQQACLFNLPVEDHDQKLDWVITPQEAFYFGDKN